MTVVEKAAYLKGIVDGIAQDKPDYKLWSALCDLLSDMAHEVEDLQANSLEHAGAIDELSEEMATVDSMLYDMGYDVDVDYGDEEAYDFINGGADTEEGETEPEEEKDNLFQLSDVAEMYTEPEDDEPEEDNEQVPEEVFYDIECPICGTKITLDEDTLASGSMNCPHCGEILEFDIHQDD